MHALSKTAVFSGLSTAEILQVLNGIHYQLRSFEPDDMVAYAGEECEDLFILLEGKVRGEINSMEGKSIVISEIKAPSSFAEGFLFARRNNLKISIRALTDARIVFIQKRYFSRLLNENPRILENYLGIISNRFIIVTEKLNFLMIRNVKGKLAYYLINQANAHKGATSFPLGRTQEKLAELLGITRPALNRNLLDLKKMGIISMDKKMLSILDRQALSSLIQ